MNSSKPKHFFIVISSIFGIFLLACLTSAITPGEAVVGFQDDKGAFADPTASSLVAAPGNISLVNISGNMNTFRWVGLFGNVSGSVELGDSATNVLFNWIASGRYVYASTASSINWLTINASNLTGVLSQYPYLINGSDNFTSTFNVTGTLNSEIVGIITSVPKAVTFNSSGAQVWPTLSLTDGSNIIFTGVVNASGDNSYSNETVNYQMIIPENGLDQSPQPTEYYLWVELA